MDTNVTFNTLKKPGSKKNFFEVKHEQPQKNLSKTLSWKESFYLQKIIKNHETSYKF